MSTSLAPNLMTENVNASIEFYCNRLGFTYLNGMIADSEQCAAEYSAQTPLQWAMLSRSGAMLMLQERTSIAGDYSPFAKMPVAASAAFYLEVGDLDKLLAGLGSDVDIVVPDRTTFYGMREVWIRDNNGYIVTLAQKAQ
jgi:uncharacterized glyoxalase superfamily protein PhnB